MKVGLGINPNKMQNRRGSRPYKTSDIGEGLTEGKLFISGYGGMADAWDLKSLGRKLVRVQVSLPALHIFIKMPILHKELVDDGLAS